jgi:hypothetical protein
MMLTLRVLAVLTGLMLWTTTAQAQSEDRTRAFNAPLDRVWSATKSTLTGLGWEIDKEDRNGGWITTDSRTIEGGNYGVYAKGLRHRLRVQVGGQPGSNRSTVTIERRVFKRERILWMDKEENVPTTDRSVENQIFDAIARSLGS